MIDTRLGIAAPPRPGRLGPGLPAALHFRTVELSPTDRFGAPLVGTTTAGCTWWDTTAAEAAAIGEAAEWYCGSLVPDTLRHAPRSALDGPAIGPDATLYRPDQYAADGFPFVPFTDDLVVGWTRGTDLDTGEPVHVAASLVHLGYGSGPTYGVPRVNLPVNAGIAAGPDTAAARRSAVRELLERDAFATAWHTGADLPELALPDRWSGLFGTLRPRLHQVPNPYGAHVLLAVLHHEDGGVLGVGAAMRPDPVDAALKAFAEAAMSVAVAADLVAEDSTVLPRLLAPHGALKPWRADRAYRDSYRADLRDVIDITCHVQWYLDPRSQKDLHTRLDAGGRSGALDDLAPTPDADELRRAAGLTGAQVDVTTSDVAAAGLHVVRVVVPALRSTAPAALPFLGGLGGVTVLDPVPHA